MEDHRGRGAVRIRRRRVAGILSLTAVLSLSGCAYSFSGTNIPGYIKTIAIPNFENDTLEPGVEQETTSGVLDAFIRDGRLKIAPEGTADSRLVGTVVGYENKVYNYAADQTPQSYIVVLTASVTLRDEVKNRVLWEDDAIVRTAIYAPGGSGAELGGEDDARQEAISLLANDLVSRTLEQW